VIPAAHSEEPLAEDVLFLACTRPAMIAGAPMEAVGLNLMISATAFLAGRSLLYLLVAPAVHLVCAAVCRSDHNAFRLLWLFVETKGRARNAGLWGGGSPPPLPTARRFAARELDHG
jgi:type IV secretion system protein VirB3